ncbi:thioesterase family protein [Aestuariimicrobium sp. p3-SID1156]|uniref:thioesterase family protein n=1 Tax=Aestuariimicrobium sp. p3-SID1156 TaxID=2916038 RepID=UPI00223A7920|nr:thioesterase family protein [Aestuariimicrobium sp. p3-SID1156]MCT1458315.1 thioesterase family protein [Aestuariimicrobium sp. p3-SID1156]
MIEPGSTSTFTYTVPLERTVPYLYPESEEFQTVPNVFATGYMVGLLEWACMRHLEESGHLEDGQISVGTHINVSHTAATLPGQVVTVDVTCTAVGARSVDWEVTARDERDEITSGTHQRAVLDKERFLSGLRKKSDQVRQSES